MKGCEYVLIQYVPLPHGEVCMPIGLILLDERGVPVRHAIRPDWRAVRCIDPRADLTLLQALPDALSHILKPESGSARQALAEVSERGLGAIRFSSPRGVETEDLHREFDRLFEEHIPLPRAADRPREAGAASRVGSRRWIHARLRAALEQRPWGERLRQNVLVDEFTAPGDSFRIDFSYRPNGVTKFLHALSLEHDRNQAKVLSYTFGRIRAAMPAALTVVVAKDTEASSPLAVQGSRRILHDSGILIQPLASLDRLLDQMQQEMSSA